MRLPTGLASIACLTLMWNALAGPALAQEQTAPQAVPARSSTEKTAASRAANAAAAISPFSSPSVFGRVSAKLSLQRRDWLLLGGATGAVVASVFEHPGHSCPCSVSHVNGLDRFATRQSSEVAGTASNVLVEGALPATVLATLILDKRNDPSTNVAADLAIVGETALINTALLQVVKKTVARPRPLAYRATDPAVLGMDDTYQSFYSGHTSTAVAIGLSYAQLYLRRHQNRHAWLVNAGFWTLGTTIGALRVGAGKHFPTDVMTGAAVGATLGLAIPKLHNTTIN